MAARRDDKNSPPETGSAAANAGAVLLDGRTWNGAVRAEHAAIARFRLKPAAAADAVIEELASVSRHGLCGLVAADGTGQGRLQLQYPAVLMTFKSGRSRWSHAAGVPTNTVPTDRATTVPMALCRSKYAHQAMLMPIHSFAVRLNVRMGHERQSSM